MDLTTWRSVIACSSASRVKPSTRAASATNGALASWPWSGVRRLIASCGVCVPAVDQTLPVGERGGELFAREDPHRAQRKVERMALAFTLPDTSGYPVALHEDGARAAVVVFTCNHCPYALAWHERLQDVARDYADRGVRFLQINSNNAEKYPRDSRGRDARAGRRGRVRRAVPGRRVAGGRAGLGREDDAGRVRDRRVRRGLSGRAGRRPRRSLAERGVAAGGARRRARRACRSRRPETKPVGCSIKWK